MGDSSLSWVPVIGTAINAWSQERNLEENANQARIQREWQEKMWNKNNQYNTPLAQKQRLEEAGINPYSVMAQGGSDTGVSSSPPQSYQRAEANFHSPFNEEAIMNSIILAQQARGMELDNESKGISLKYQEQNEVKRLIKLDEEIGLMISEKKEHNQNTEYLEHLSELTRKRIDSLVRGSEAEASVTELHLRNLQRQYDDEHLMSVVKRASINADIRLSNARISQVAQEIQESISRIALNASSSALNYEQVRSEIQKQASEITNRVIKREDNKRSWNSLYMEVSKTMYDIWERGRTAKTIFGEWRPPLPGTTRDYMDSMHTPYSFPINK